MLFPDFKKKIVERSSNPAWTATEDCFICSQGQGSGLAFDGVTVSWFESYHNTYNYVGYCGKGTVVMGGAWFTAYALKKSGS